MRSPQFLHNGETPPRISGPHFHSTVSVHKLRRFNALILVPRLFAFCFSLSDAVFMAANTRSDEESWTHFDAFRFVLAANGSAAIYSFVEVEVSVWEILNGDTLFPEGLQVWFDFGHDQSIVRSSPTSVLLGFAYLLLSANAAGTALAQTLREEETCTAAKAFCVQSDISIALGFAGFLFLGFSSLLSGFRVACYIITGSRSHL